MNIHQRFKEWRRSRQINFQFHILRELFLQDHCPFEDPARTIHGC